jgi:predicted O-linked N-acetylglucosamine transferase (SPINDLY family)
MTVGADWPRRVLTIPEEKGWPEWTAWRLAAYVEMAFALEDAKADRGETSVHWWHVRECDRIRSVYAGIPSIFR